MNEGFRQFVRAHWPKLRLRLILFIVLFVTAAMPAASAIFLRVYENALVRRTEGELVSEGAALVAAAAELWPGPRPPAGQSRTDNDPYYPEATHIDLHASPILPDRPRPRVTGEPDPDAAQDGQALAPILAQTARTTAAAVLLLDSHGRIAYGGQAGGDLSALPEVQAALAGRTKTVLRRNAAYQPRAHLEWLSRASDIQIHHARPILIGGRVEGVMLLSHSPRALFRGLYEDRGKVALTAVGVLVLLLVLAELVARTITRPIETLGRAIKSVAAGREAPLDPPATAAVEIQDLYADFGVMAEAIRRRSQYLRDFAAAVSHEFKTPLAGIAGASELLQDHGDSMSPAERRKFLGNISGDTARLTRLVGRLLDMARADMAQPEADARADVAACAEAVAAGFVGRIRVEVSLPPGLPPAAAPGATLERVLTTLVENSLQAGAGEVWITGFEVDGQIVLSIADNGPGVPDADRDRLFEPFFTTRRKDGGAGMGLAIARSLMEASRGSLRLARGVQGARFDLSLPAAPRQA